MGFMVTSLSRIDPADGSFDLSAFAWIITPDSTFDPANQLQILARESAIEAVQQAPVGDGSTFTGLRIEATLDQAFSLPYSARLSGASARVFGGPGFSAVIPGG